MCGVVAALGQDDIALKEALELLSHRGIRSTIRETDTGMVGHVRLPIVGVGSDHDQPLQKHDWTIGFVGELLDFRETDPGMECDAELVADIWWAEGPYGFTERDGFWGIVALHEKTQTLHVLTDYLGQKPMYYRSDYPSAGSEIDCLIPFGPVSLDHVYLSACVKWGYCPDVSRTPYNEIKHLQPGEHVVLREGDVDAKIVDPLTPLPFANRRSVYDEIVAATKRRAMSSDVDVACLLSGGLDSSIVYTLAARYNSIKPYCAVTTHDTDDLAAAQRVYAGTHRIDYDEVDARTALMIMQEPIDLGSLRPQIALSNAIPQYVCLTGDGADELFGGYGRSQRYDSQYSDVFHELPAWHLPRLDRAMMRNRIEVRSPFLARNVARYALGLPHEMRKDKNLLRGLFKDDLPSSVANAPKKALRTPEIATDREYYSKVLVDLFVENFNGG